MLWIGIILALIITIIIFLLLVLKVHIHLSFIYLNGQPMLSIQLLLYSKQIYKKSFLITIDENEKENISIAQLPKQLGNMYHSFIDRYELIIKHLHHISLHKFSWVTHLGVGEASVTGLVIGPVWVVKGMVVGVISRKVKCFPSPEISIRPHFLREKFHTELTCIGSIRLGKAIHALIKITKDYKYKRRRKYNG